MTNDNKNCVRTCVCVCVCVCIDEMGFSLTFNAMLASKVGEQDESFSRTWKESRKQRGRKYKNDILVDASDQDKNRK